MIDLKFQFEINQEHKIKKRFPSLTFLWSHKVYGKLINYVGTTAGHTHPRKSVLKM